MGHSALTSLKVYGLDSMSPWQPLADCRLLTLLLFLFLAREATETHCISGKLHVEREHVSVMRMEELRGDMGVLAS